MSPEEALARLRRELAFAQEHAQWPSVHRRDLRALLDAYDAARAEGVAAERARVVADLRAEAAMVGEAGGGERLRLLAFTFERVEHVPEGT